MSGLVPLPGGGSQIFGRGDFGRQAEFHNVERFVSHEHPKPLAVPDVREETTGGEHFGLRALRPDTASVLRDGG